MVFYRKYRSQTIAELDSPKLRETLYSVLSGKDVPHAFLFTGPKGLGKTSTARIIAKVLNCTHDTGNKEQGTKNKKQNEEAILSSSSLVQSLQRIEPDNTCDQCISITNGTNIDVLEIDGASNRGIDEVRDLREKVRLAPAAARKKVYIIDEVHMLTTEAFNALLKTIEEPPAHVVFIFCTTEPQKVPATIISRCFHIALQRATEDEIVHALTRIKDGEKLQIDEDALRMIALMADGGYRDATKMLEEIVLLANGKPITKEFVESTLHVSGISSLVSRMLESLEKRDIKKSLEIVQEVSQKGIDIKTFLFEFLSCLHEMLLQISGLTLPNTKYKIPDTKYSSDDIQELVALFSEAYQQTKYAVIASLPLEIAVVKWCTTEETKGDTVIAGKQSEAKQSNTPVILGKREALTPESKKEGSWTSQDDNVSTQPTVKDLINREKNLKVQQIIKGSKEPQEPEGPKENTVQHNLPEDSSDAKHLMENLIYKVKPYNHSVAGVLRGCVIKSISNEKIVFETAYAFHKERLDDKKVKDVLHQAIREITGKPLQVMIELKS